MSELGQLLMPSIGIIRSKRWESADTATLGISISDRSVLSYAPGQFNMLYVHGVGEIPISISGLNRTRQCYLHTVRGVGSVSDAILGLKRGDQIGIRGPYGNHWPLDKSIGGNLLIVAGGLGIAPLRPAIQWCVRNRERFSELQIIYGARTPKDLILCRDWDAWFSHQTGTFQSIVDRPDSCWRGLVGTPLDVLPRNLLNPKASLALVCGPEIMMRYVCRELVARGFSSDQIFVSLERNMQCAIGICGRCQIERKFVCHDGPIFSFSSVASMLAIPEL